MIKFDNNLNIVLCFHSSFKSKPKSIKENYDKKSSLGAWHNKKKVKCGEPIMLVYLAQISSTIKVTKKMSLGFLWLFLTYFIEKKRKHF